MNVWHLAIATAFCVLIVACSHRESVFSLPPAFTAKSSVSASDVAHCVAQRWKRGARRLHRREGDGVITLRAESFFGGVAIGLRVEPEGAYTRVEFFRRRHTEPRYGSMVRDCLRPDTSPEADGADGASEVSQS